MPILYLDAGRAFAFRKSDSDIMVPATIGAYEDLSLDVLNTGSNDLDGGFNYFSALARAATFRCISANLVDLDRGQPVLPPYVVVTPRLASARAGGPKVAVVGLTEALKYRILDGPDRGKIHFLDPVKAADEPLARARREGDVLVVLGNFGEGAARLLAGKHPEIDVIIAADERVTNPMQEEFNKVPIFFAGTEGKRLLRLGLHHQRGPRRWRVEPEIVELNARILDDREGARLVAELQGAISKRKIRASESHPFDESPVPYVGSEICGSCHAQAVAAWRNSAHARAWDTIRKDDHDRISLCHQCHTTGYQQPGGGALNRLPPKLAAVGCEACHGPGGRHVGDPKQAGLTRSSEESCRSCHTPGQTPDFNYAEHWARIRH